MVQAVAEELGGIPMSPTLQATLVRAREYAAGQSHREVVLEHLLLALTEDDEAALVMQSCRVDLGQLRNDVAGYLGSLNDRARGTAQPAISAQLTQILKYAMLAARQGRRLRIDGAIVLAAIVGDGKSMGASFLKAQGLTFEATVKVLQQAVRSSGAGPQSQSPAGPQPPPAMPMPELRPRAASTEDILAAARERVGSRVPMAQNAEPTTTPLRTAPPHRAPIPAAIPDAATAVGDGSGPPRLPDAALAAAAAPSSGIADGSAGLTGDAADRNGAALAGMPLPAAEPSGPLPAPLAVPAPAAPSWAPPPLPAEPSPGPARLPLPPLAPLGGAGLARPAGPPPVPYALTEGFSPPAPVPPPWAAPADLRPARAGTPRPPAGPGAAASSPLAQISRDGPPMPQVPTRREPGGPEPAVAQPQSGPRSPAIEAGQLSHTIPSRLALGAPHIIEVHVKRSPLSGGGSNSRPLAQRSDMVTARAISVRLRPAKGSFAIDQPSPETQWDKAVDGARLAGEGAVWRFSIQPTRLGRGALLLAVTARTVAADGTILETALPDQIIEVRIGRDWRQSLTRWAAMAAAGIALVLVEEAAEEVFKFDLLTWLMALLRL
jgi:hypothetical protein